MSSNKKSGKGRKASGKKLWLRILMLVIAFVILLGIIILPFLR